MQGTVGAVLTEAANSVCWWPWAGVTLQDIVPCRDSSKYPWHSRGLDST